MLRAKACLRSYCFKFDFCFKRAPHLSSCRRICIHGSRIICRGKIDHFPAAVLHRASARIEFPCHGEYVSRAHAQLSFVRITRPRMKNPNRIPLIHNSGAASAPRPNLHTFSEPASRGDKVSGWTSPFSLRSYAPRKFLHEKKPELRALLLHIRIWDSPERN